MSRVFEVFSLEPKIKRKWRKKIKRERIMLWYYPTLFITLRFIS